MSIIINKYHLCSELKKKNAINMQSLLSTGSSEHYRSCFYFLSLHDPRNISVKRILIYTAKYECDDPTGFFLEGTRVAHVYLCSCRPRRTDIIIIKHMN